MNKRDYDTIETMSRCGGSFAKALAEAARRADPDNLQRIKSAFPEIWGRYEDTGGFADKPLDEIMNDRCRANPNDREASDWVYRNLK